MTFPLSVIVYTKIYHSRLEILNMHLSQAAIEGCSFEDFYDNAHVESHNQLRGKLYIIFSSITSLIGDSLYSKSDTIR